MKGRFGGGRTPGLGRLRKLSIGPCPARSRLSAPRARSIIATAPSSMTLPRELNKRQGIAPLLAAIGHRPNVERLFVALFMSASRRSDSNFAVLETGRRLYEAFSQSIGDRCCD